MRADVAALMALPPAPFDACDKVATRVSSLPLVRYQNNEYSAPARYGHQDILASRNVDWIKFVCRRFYRQPLTQSKQISNFRCSSLPFDCYE
jgi:hypothetical protein